MPSNFIAAHRRAQHRAIIGVAPRACLAALLAVPAFGAERVITPTPCPIAAESVAIAEALAGDRVRLTDGRAIALAGIEVPRRLGRAALGADAAHETAARVALTAILAERPITLAVLGPTDRRGNIPGRIAAAGGDAAEALLAAGHVRIRPTTLVKSCLAGLRAAEAIARAAPLGLWATEEFRLRAGDDTDLPSRADSYAVVEGRVVSTGRAGQRRYIDFGRNHRTDFTVVVDGRKSGAFAAGGFDLDRLKGRRIRVRGWLTAHDGAEMVLDAPEEMEWVDEGNQPAPAAPRGVAAPG